MSDPLTDSSRTNCRMYSLWIPVIAVIVLTLLFTVSATCTAYTDATGGSSAVAAPPLMGSFVNITADAATNLDPVIAYNSRHDEYLVVWWNDGGATADIHAQRVNKGGTIGNPFTIVSVPNQINYLPDVAYNAKDDQYLVVYTRRVSSTDYDIFARRVAWNGSWISQDIAIKRPSGSQGTQWYPAVAYNSQNNEYLIVYENYWSNDLRDIDAHRVRGHDGAWINWSNIAHTPNTIRRLPDVSYNEARNEYLIAYTYQANSTSDGDIRARILSSNMDTLAPEIALVDNTLYQDSVSLTAGPGEYMAIWSDGPGAGHHTLYGRRINGDGTISQFIPIMDETGKKNVEPAVTYSPFYGYVALWRHISPTTSDDIYGRTIVPKTRETGPVFAVDNFLASSRSPTIACAPTGECLLAEEDDTRGNYDIWVRTIDLEWLFIPSVEN